MSLVANKQLYQGLSVGHLVARCFTRGIQAIKLSNVNQGPRPTFVTDPIVYTNLLHKSKTGICRKGSKSLWTATECTAAVPEGHPSENFAAYL